MAACPTDRELEHVATGHTESATLEKHLEECTRCAARLADIRLNNELLVRLGESAAVHREPTPGVPDHFPGFRILSIIDRGGQGVVYKAIQLGTKRKVALKVLIAGVFATVRERSRFEREVDLVASLRHPNIVTVYESGVTPDGRPYLAMEYVHGLALGVYLGDHTLTIDETLQLFQEVCAAINYAHQRGVIHRDLKPSNILIDEIGKPRILDFGLAKAAGTSLADGAPVTVTGEFVGTLAYASPEQTKGDPNLIDVRTDVYSLGVILFEMLTGRFPYEVVGNMRDVLDRIMNAEPAKPSTIRRQINDEVETIVLKCLSKDRDRRYQTAGELATDISQYLAGEPIAAKRDSSWYVLRKTLRRYRGRVATAAGLLLLLVAFSITITIMYRQAQRERGASQRVRAAVMEMLNALAVSPGDSGKGTLDKLLEEGVADLLPELEKYPTEQVAYMESVAGVYESHRRYDEAVKWRRRALVIRRSQLADDAPGQATALHSLASALLQSFDFEGAERSARESLAIHEGDSDSPDAEIAGTLSLLANILWKAGNYEIPLPYFQRALDIRRSRGADPSDELVRTLIDFGRFMHDRAEYEESERLIREATESCSSLYPDQDHPFAGEAFNALGMLLQDRAQYSEADAHLRQALEVVRRIYGNDHIVVARTQNHLGLLARNWAEQVYWDVGSYRWGRPRYAPLWLFPEGTADRAAASLAMATILVDPATAERWCQDAIDIYRKLLPEDHPELATAHTRLGIILMKQWDPQATEAAEPLRQALTIRRDHLPADHWQTHLTANELGGALVGLGQFAEAESLLLESYPVIEADRGLSHQRTREALSRLICLYLAQDNQAKADHYLAMFADGVSDRPCYEYRGEGGTIDAAFDLDYDDDELEKTLYVELGAIQSSGELSARLVIVGQGYNWFGYMSKQAKDFRILVNGDPQQSILFDVGEAFALAASQSLWFPAAFDIPVAWLVEGANTFALTKPHGHWEYNNLRVAIDTDSDEERSSWYGNNEDCRIPQSCRGELMISLEICTSDGSLAAGPQDGPSLGVAAYRELGPTLTRLGTALNANACHTAAERLLREAMKLRQELESREPLGSIGLWWGHRAQLGLGETLLAQGRYGEAEPLLLSSYEEIARHAHKTRTLSVLRRLIELYEAWRKPERAEPYATELDALGGDEERAASPSSKADVLTGH